MPAPMATGCAAVVKSWSFRQFIRLRLTETGLTAYVIAMDKLADPGDPKARPRPFLIDAFEIKPRA